MFQVLVTLKTLGFVYLTPANQNQILEFLMNWGIGDDLMKCNLILFNLEPGDAPFWFENSAIRLEVVAMEEATALIA